MPRDIVTSENREEFIQKKLDEKAGKKPMEDKVIGTMLKNKKAGKEIDIGQGRYVHRHGMDENGNHSIWYSQGSGRARKIQTLNLPSVHRNKPDLTEAGIREIHEYADKYHKNDDEKQ